jgi:hypothetical protein
MTPPINVLRRRASRALATTVALIAGLALAAGTANASGGWYSASNPFPCEEASVLLSYDGILHTGLDVGCIRPFGTTIVVKKSYVEIYRASIGSFWVSALGQYGQTFFKDFQCGHGALYQVVVTYTDTLGRTGQATTGSPKQMC